MEILFGLPFAIIALVAFFWWAIKMELPSINAESARLTSIEKDQDEQTRLLDKMGDLRGQGNHELANFIHKTQYKPLAKSVHRRLWNK